MDSDNAKQHDNYVQRDDGHEQDDESPQRGRDERQEHSRAVEHDAEERHEQDEADDGSDHMRDRDRQRAVSRRNCAVVSRPGGCCRPSAYHISIIWFRSLRRRSHRQELRLVVLGSSLQRWRRIRSAF
jgi:hypothetical protein